MIRIFFVRHAQPEYAWKDERTRPLTEEGKRDAGKVLEFLRDKNIGKFYCSPYKRSIDTILKSAEYFRKEIVIDERLRERESGPNGNNREMFQRRWADHEFHENGGESIAMVQKRNIKALEEILSDCGAHGRREENVVIGTHGTALSSILNYYNGSFDCDSFLRIIDWMPYIIELDFEDGKLTGTAEHIYVEKEFK